MSLRSSWKRFFRLTESIQHVEEQVDDELQYHIENLIDRYQSEGMSEKEAWVAVKKRFNDLETTRTALIARTIRTMNNHWRRLYIDGLRHDLRVSLRQFRRRPGFTALAVLTLGLGIGASSTLFSAVNGVLLRPLPYPESDRLVHVGTVRTGRESSWITAPEFLALRTRARSFESYAAFQHVTLNALIRERPEQFTVAEVTEDYFEVYGMSPVLGRAFSEQDYRADASPVVLLSYRIWQQHWGGDPQVLGTVITASPIKSPEASSYTIVGVMPPTFQFTADLWKPIRLAGTKWEHEEWRFGSFVFTSIGRLRPGMRLEDAQAEAASVTTFLAAEYPQYYSGRFNEGRNIAVVPLLDRMVEGSRSIILLLFGATMILLVIAVANLIGFLLARAFDRRYEITIRSKLGAGYGRIFRHLGTESMFLSLLGGGVGFVIAVGGMQVLRVLAPMGFPRIDNLTPDIRVVFFAVAIALMSGLLSSTVPLVSTTRHAFNSSLRGVGRTRGRKNTARLRSFLMSVQIALSVVLLVGAGLLSTSLLKLQKVDPGIKVEDLLVIPIQLPGSYDTVEKHNAFFGDVVRQLSSIPGIESASWIPDPPMYGRNMSSQIRTEEMGDEDVLPLVGIHPVGPDYFTTMGISVLNGRGIAWADEVSNVPIAVVDEVMANQIWPSENPVGRKILLGDVWFTVVGVVGRIHQATLGQEARPEVYVAALQHNIRFNLNRMVIHSAIPLEGLAPLLRAAVWEVDPTLPVPTIETMEDRISADLHNPQFYTFMVSAFSLTAAILTLIGIYALMLYLVTGRTREIGIRIALGANAKRVLWTVSRQCLGLIGIGTLVGLGAAIATSRLLSGLLFGITPLDPPTYAGVVAVLGLTAVLACLVPARRAMKVDPMTALRRE